MKMLKPQTPVKSIKSKRSGESHCDSKAIGMGDNYGSSIKSKVGRMREDSLGYNNVIPAKLKTPPRSLA